jgi:hypothetical protein
LFAILGTLDSWRTSPRKRGPLSWELPYRPFPVGDGWGFLRARPDVGDLFTPPPRELEEVPFRFSCPSWNPFEETRGKFKKRALETLERDLDRQLDQVENLMALLKNPKTPRKLSANHFSWLVQYQVQGLRYKEIRAGSDDVSHDQSVVDGVQDAARQVVGPCWQVSLRRAKRGRPRSA